MAALTVMMDSMRNWRKEEVSLVEAVALQVRGAVEVTRARLREREARVRQRAFLRDVLASVTEGRLILCQMPEELPAAPAPASAPIPLTTKAGLHELRRATEAACEAAELSQTRCFDLVTAASEAGMNAIVHSGEGAGYVFVDKDKDVVQVWVADKGGGIAVEDLPNATLRKGYSSAGTLGHGMKMMLQTADRVFLLTGVTGTTVVLEMDRVVKPSW